MAISAKNPAPHLRDRLATLVKSRLEAGHGERHVIAIPIDNYGETPEASIGRA